MTDPGVMGSLSLVPATVLTNIAKGKTTDITPVLMELTF
jgi:hypothetical protein